MTTPKQTENVTAFKRPKGKVTVHGWRKQGRMWDAVADCGKVPVWYLRSWLWLEFRTLNPELVVLCRKCWTETPPVLEET